jgi:hypothetical protein
LKLHVLVLNALSPIESSEFVLTADVTADIQTLSGLWRTSMN